MERKIEELVPKELDKALSGEAPNQLRSTPTVLDERRNIFEQTKREVTNRSLSWSPSQHKVLATGFGRPRQRWFKANNENILPISSKDEPNTHPERARNWTEFVRSVRWRVMNIPPPQHATLLILCATFLGSQVKIATFDFHNIVSTNAPQSLLSFSVVFAKFLPEMVHMTIFMLCSFLTLVLVWPLELGVVQIFIVLLLISSPLHYFTDLARKASGIDVACGSFKLPLILFATLGAVGLTLILGILTLLMLYFSWRYINEGGRRTQQPKVSLDDLKGLLV